MRLIKKFKIIYPNYNITIFSEGDEEDFKDIVNAYPTMKIVMHINENIQSSFHHLVMADVLIIAKSSFSYCAALLNKNTIVANLITTWWHEPLSSWKII